MSEGRPYEKLMGDDFDDFIRDFNKVNGHQFESEHNTPKYSLIDLSPRRSFFIDDEEPKQLFRDDPDISIDNFHAEDEKEEFFKDWDMEE